MENSMKKYRKYILIAALFSIWVATMIASTAYGQSITICNINGNNFIGGQFIIELDPSSVKQLTKTHTIILLDLSFKGVSPYHKPISKNTYQFYYSNMKCLETFRAYKYLKTLNGIKSVYYNKNMRHMK